MQVREMMMENTELETEVAEIKRAIERKALAKAQADVKELQSTLMWLLRPLSDVYGKETDENSPGKSLTGIIQRAWKRTGKQAVVVIDEYDAPLLDVLHDDAQLKAMRKVMQEFYTPLKANEQYVKFCFITGITKFSQLSIFSTINNITNVTMDTMFSAICGITEEELSTVMKEDIERLAGIQGLSYEQMHHKLKERYDGYHFTKNSPEIYNPFSLLKAFQQREVANYWFESGTPTFLITSRPTSCRWTGWRFRPLPLTSLRRT